MASNNQKRSTPMVVEYAEKRVVFLKELESHGIVREAAKAAGLDRSELYHYRKRNPDFAALWEAAQKVGDEAIKDEVRYRAMIGVETVVAIGGEREVIRKKSDVLLMFLAKSRFAEFRDTQPQVNVNTNIGIEQERPYAAIRARIRANMEAKEAAEQGNGKHIENGRHED